MGNMHQMLGRLQMDSSTHHSWLSSLMSLHRSREIYKGMDLHRDRTNIVLKGMIQSNHNLIQETIWLVDQHNNLLTHCSHKEVVSHLMFHLIQTPTTADLMRIRYCSSLMDLITHHWPRWMRVVSPIAQLSISTQMRMILDSLVLLSLKKTVSQVHTVMKARSVHHKWVGTQWALAITLTTLSEQDMVKFNPQELWTNTNLNHSQ